MNTRAGLLFLFLGACAGAPPPPPLVPEGAGRGLLSADAEAPAGARTWARPAWRVGDETVLIHGERQQGKLVVKAATDAYYELDPGGGTMLRRDLDLGELGGWTATGEARREMVPVDVRYHWPLWVGKRWSCEFVTRGPGIRAVTWRADYLVEDLDTVKVTAGTFEALRIVRTVRPIEDGDHLTQAQITWYAPDVGREVRHLGGTWVELASYTSPR